MSRLRLVRRWSLARRQLSLLAGSLILLALVGILVHVGTSPRLSEPAGDVVTEAPQLGSVADQPPLAEDQGLVSSFEGLTAPAASPTPARLTITTYTVQEGDTLLAVADRFGLRPETLLWANDLPNPDLIVVGQELVIPPTDGLVYTVEPGDSLRGIADRYGLDMRQVVDANGIADPDMLQAGTVLVLPGARPLAPSSVVAAGPNTAPNVVQAPAGDPTLAALLQAPLPDNVPALLGAAWLRTTAEHALYAGPEPGARRYTTLPAGVRLERTGDLAGRRIPVRDPGDGRTRLPMSGWIDVDDLEPTRSPGPRELPRAYPENTRMDIFQAFVPYRGQLDGSPYALANCGPTAIGMVLEGFGISVPPGQLRAEVLDTQRIWGNNVGTLITALASVVERHGLQTHGLYDGDSVRRWTLDDVRAELRLLRPVVVQTRYRALPGREGAAYYGDHYIVVTGILDDGFLYNDPIDFDGTGWDRVISGERLAKAMDASDRRYAFAAFSVSR